MGGVAWKLRNNYPKQKVLDLSKTIPAAWLTFDLFKSFCFDVRGSAHLPVAFKAFCF